MTRCAHTRARAQEEGGALHMSEASVDMALPGGTWLLAASLRCEGPDPHAAGRALAQLFRRALAPLAAR